MKIRRQDLPELELIDSPQRLRELLQDCLVERAAETSPLRILEAGCGRRWELELGSVDYTLVGVDVDGLALTHRKNEIGDLDEAIEADLRTASLPPASFDAVYSAFVLEHIEGASRVLDNFADWLAPGGLLILKLPDRDTVFGLITRCTPFWVHVFYARYLSRWRSADAGKAGFGPYPTYYDAVVSRAGIHDFCAKNDLVVRAEYGSNFDLAGDGLIPVAMRTVARIVGALTLGRYDHRYNDLTYILEKRAQGP